MIIIRSIMVRGGIRFGNRSSINKSSRPFKCRKIHQSNVGTSGNFLHSKLRKCNFQQNDVQPQMAVVSLQYLHNANVDILLARSPDLSAIEHIRDMIG